MSITLTPDQEQTIQGAILAGLVSSVDEFIDKAMKALPKGSFDEAAALDAVGKIKELRKGITLDRKGISIREMAHSGHKY